jgi:hypothetical protein
MTPIRSAMPEEGSTAAVRLATGGLRDLAHEAVA